MHPWDKQLLCTYAQSERGKRIHAPMLHLMMVLLIVLLLVGSGCSSPQSKRPVATPGRQSTITPGPGTKPTVFLILMENHDWQDIQGNVSAHYLNTVLLPQASYARQYYNPPGNHPSEPNYLWLEAGSNLGVTDDDSPADHHFSTTNHLVTLLQRAHISWKSYQEGIDGTECPLENDDNYAPRHNPMVFFDDVTGGNDPDSAYCKAHVRPYSELLHDLNQQTEPRYNFITPDLCHDMHDECAPSFDPIRQGDHWLQRQIPLIMASRAYQQGGIIFITWDESERESSDGPIGFLLLSPYAKGHGYSNTIHYTHSSLLRTLEELYGVKPLLGDAANATDLRDLFRTFPF
jgi:hypothetical protein